MKGDKTELFSLRTRRSRRLGVTGNYLDSVHLQHQHSTPRSVQQRKRSVYLGEVRVLTELDLLQHESPDVVAETVGVQFVSLTEREESVNIKSQVSIRFAHLEV